MSRPLLPHPMAMVFPELTAGEFQDLADSMKKNGFDPRYPIILYKGTVLDGRNRLRASTLANVKPEFSEFTGTEQEAAQFVMRANITRRHLTTGQRAAMAVALVRWIDGKSEDTEAQSDRKIARVAGRLPNGKEMSERTIRQVVEVERKSPEVFREITDGKISPRAAIKKIQKNDRPKAPPPPKPDVDAAGVPIHPKSRAALTDGIALFRSARAALTAAKRMVKELIDTPYGRQLHAQSIDTDFKNIERQLRFAAPYSTCPMDDPCDDKCGMCHGTQWISEAQYDGMPRELKNTKAVK